MAGYCLGYFSVSPDNGNACWLIAIALYWNIWTWEIWTFFNCARAHNLHVTTYGSRYKIFGRRMWSEEEAIVIRWINCVTTDLMFASTQLMHSQSMQNLFILFRACAYDLFSVHISQRPYFSLQRNSKVVYGLCNLYCARSTTRVIQLNSDDRDHGDKPLM